jgi:hypothetical protein
MGWVGSKAFQELAQYVKTVKQVSGFFKELKIQ